MAVETEKFMFFFINYDRKNTIKRKIFTDISPENMKYLKKQVVSRKLSKYSQKP